MKHNLIAFYIKSRWIIRGAISFLLILTVVVVSPLASQDRAKSNNNSALVFADVAHAQSANPDVNGISITAPGIKENPNNETLPATTAANSGATATITTASNNSNKNYLQNASSLKEVKGDIGSAISAVNYGMQENQTSQVKSENEGSEGYIVTGRWRILANQSLLERFVANLIIARTDGMESHNIIMEEEGPYFGIRANDNNNAVMSNITAAIYRNNYDLVNVTAPVQLEIRGSSIVRIVADMGETLHPLEFQILRLLDEKPVYGTIRVIEEGQQKQ